MLTLTYACHVAHLDPLTGEGMLVLPRVDDDMHMPGLPGSLHEADWSAVVMRNLDGLGWEPSEDVDGDGLTVAVGVTRDGREVIALYGREPVLSEPTVGERAEAMMALCEAAGVVVLAT